MGNLSISWNEIENEEQENENTNSDSSANSNRSADSGSLQAQVVDEEPSVYDIFNAGFLNSQEFTPPSVDLEQNAQDVPLGDAIAAFIRKNNTAYNAYKYYALKRGIFNVTTPKDPDFDLNKALESEKITLEDHSFFEGINNSTDFYNALEYYQQDKEDEELLNNASFSTRTIAGLAAGITDPVAWIPIGRALKFGTPIVKMGIETAIYGAASYTVKAEANNNFSTQDLAYDTVAAGLAGLLTGGAIKGSQALFKQANKFAKELISDFPTSHFFDRNEKGEIIEIATGPFGTTKQKLKRYAAELVNSTPAMQMETSGDPIVKTLGKACFNYSGKVNPKLTIEEEIAVLDALDLQHRTKMADLLTKAQKNIGLSREEINYQVGQIVVNGKVPEGTDPLIEKIAKEYSDYVIETCENAGRNVSEAVTLPKEKKVLDYETAILPEDTIREMAKSGKLKATATTAEGYVPREYNNNALYEKPEEVVELLRKTTIANHPNWTEQQVSERVASTYNTITGNKIGAEAIANYIFNPAQSKTSVLKSRTIPIADTLLLRQEMQPFDVVTSGRRQLRTIYVEGALNNKVKEIAPICFDKKTASKIETYQDFLDALAKKRNVEQGQLLQKGAGKEIVEETRKINQYNYQLVKDVFDLLKGNFGKSEHTDMIAGMRALQYMMTGGSIAISMITDPAMLLLRHDLGKVLKQFLPWNRLKKAPKEELLAFMNQLDRGLKANKFYSLGFEDTSSLMAKAARTYSKATGENFIDRFLRSTAVELEYSQIIDNSLKNNVKFLENHGFTEEMRKNIVENFDKFGSKTNNILYLDPNLLDKETAKRVIAYTNTAVKQMVLEPAIGNVPRIFKTSGGSFLYMYMTYPHLLSQHVFEPLLNGTLSKTAFGKTVIAGLSLATAKQFISSFINDREVDPTSIEFWQKVVEDSQLCNHVIDAIFRAEDALSGNIPLSSVSSTEGWLNNSIRAVRSLLIGRTDKYGYTHRKVTRSFRNMLPFANIWYLRPLTNDLVPTANKKTTF